MPGRRVILLDMATEDAEDFVRKVAAGGGVNVIPDGEYTETVERYAATVEAVVARPMNPCKCAMQAESKGQRRRRLVRQEGSGWTRGTRLGWWLHAECRKPSQAAITHWISSMLVGANDLLPEILGTGPAIPPSLRWLYDGGVTNEHADGNHFTPGIVRAMNGETKQRRKPRRSEIDRKARERSS